MVYEYEPSMSGNLHWTCEHERLGLAWVLGWCLLRLFAGAWAWHCWFQFFCGWLLWQRMACGGHVLAWIVCFWVLLLWLWSLFDRDPPFTKEQLAALTAGDKFPVIDWPVIFDVEATPLDRALKETFADPTYSSVTLEF